MRNRAKRLIREFFRTTTGLPTFDMVVVVKTGAHQLTAAKAADELASATARAAQATPSKSTRLAASSKPRTQKAKSATPARPRKRS